LLLLLAVACGAAATSPSPETEQDVIAPQAVEPGQEEVVVENEQGEVAVAAPTPSPEPVGAANEAIKKKDRITILMASFGNEIYNARYIQGDKGLWWYPMQARMIHSNRNMKLTDEGIISNWEVTENGLGWELTVEEGLTFHDGSPSPLKMWPSACNGP
jgi:ABC-type transport system substrate-binding protein